MGTLAKGVLADHCPTSAAFTACSASAAASMAGLKMDGAVYVTETVYAGFGLAAGVFDEVRRKV